MNIDTNKLVQILSEDKSQPVSVMVVQDEGKDKVVCLFALPHLVHIVTEFGNKLLRKPYHQVGKWYCHNDHPNFLVRIDSINPFKTSGWDCNDRPFENEFTLISQTRTYVYEVTQKLNKRLYIKLKKELTNGI